MKTAEEMSMRALRDYDRGQGAKHMCVEALGVVDRLKSQRVIHYISS